MFKIKIELLLKGLFKMNNKISSLQEKIQILIKSKKVIQ